MGFSTGANGGIRRATKPAETLTAVALLTLAACGAGGSPTDSGGRPPGDQLSVSPDGRYLVGADGSPFFMVGDAAQSAAGALTLAEFQTYIDTRVSQGFNTVNINFIEHYYSQNPPADRSGNFPFTKQLGGAPYTSVSEDPDLTSPNDAYWAALEQKVAYAQSKGVLVSLAFFMGKGPQSGCAHHTEGWYGELCVNSLANATAFGTYLANGHGPFGGFKRHSNVMWLWGADVLFTDTATRDKLRAVAAAIKAAGSTQLMSGDWNRGLATQQTGFETFMDLQAVYEYGSLVIGDASRAGFAYVPSAATGDGRALPALPTFMKETGYEDEANPVGDIPSLRNFAWSAILSGCTAGYWYGQRDVWNFARPSQGYSPCLFAPCADWTTSITSTGAQDMARLSSFIRSLAFYKLAPSGTSAPFIGRLLITDGNDASVGGHISAAQASDGTLMLVYVASTGTGTQTFSVDLRSMAGHARARWWNPTSGAFTDITQGAYAIPNTPSEQSFTTPGDNGTGSNDWILVLDT